MALTKTRISTVSRARLAILAERGAQLIERRNQRRSFVVRTHLRKDCVEEADMLHHRRKLSGLDAAMAGIAVSGNNRLELLGEIAADQVPNDEQIGARQRDPKTRWLRAPARGPRRRGCPPRPAIQLPP